MNKRIILCMIILTLMLGITACGNPLNSLPEVSETNYVENYDVENKTYGNGIIDLIVGELSGNSLYYGGIRDIEIYNRIDDTNNKDFSKLYVKIVSTSVNAEYVNYFIVSLDYNADEKRWEIKDCEADEDKDTEINILAYKTGEEIENDIYENVYSFYFEEVDAYVYPSDIVSISVNDIECEKIDQYQVQCTYNVSLSLKENNYYYSTDAVVVYNFYTADSYYDDEYWCYYDTQAVFRERYIDPEIISLLSEDKLLTDFGEYGLSTGNFSTVLTTDMITSSEFMDVQVTYAGCSREAFITVQIMEGLYATYDVIFNYVSDDEGNWSLDIINAYRNGYEITEDIQGTYLGIVVSNVNDEELGSVRIVVDSSDEEKIYGTIEFATDGNLDAVEPVVFEATYDEVDWEFAFSLESKITFKTGSRYDSFSLFAEPVENIWKSGEYSALQFFINKE